MTGTWITLIVSTVLFVAIAAYKSGKSIFDK